jgi:glycosyltransferase involved in cell wall biosynthesis
VKISVALCTHNGEKYIVEQVNSILQQSWPITEIIICDDNSSDNTVSLIKEYFKNSKFSFKLYFNNQNIGAIRNFEKCISLCSGDVIFLSDQDDIWHENKVEEIMSIFLNDKTALMVFTDGNLIDEYGNKFPGTLWSKWNFNKELQDAWRNNDIAFNYLIGNNNKITGATAAFKSSLKKYIFPFELPKSFWHDAWLGIIASGKNGLRFIDNPLIEYRIHNNQQVGIGNGIQSKSGDKQYSTVSDEYFLKKLCVLFPNKLKLLGLLPVSTESSTFFTSFFNKVVYLVKKIAN